MKPIGHAKELAACFQKQNRIALFVGSGINGTNAPQWGGLLDDLLKAALGPHALDEKVAVGEIMSMIKDAFNDSCPQASIVKLLMGNKRYREYLKHAIYKYHSATDLRNYIKQTTKQNSHDENRFGYLKAAARMSLLPNVKAVITYNYDNMLEQVIAAMQHNTPSVQEKKRIISISSSLEMPLKRNDLPVYHVHGFLPDPNGPVHQDSEVILAWDEYLETFSDPDSWQSATQLHYLRNCTCVYLGTSLNDWNMIRLLQRSVSDGHQLTPSKRSVTTDDLYHYCIALDLDSQSALEKKSGRTTQGMNMLDRLRSTLWQSVGIKPIYVSGDYSSLPKILENIMDHAQKEMERLR